MNEKDTWPKVAIIVLNWNGWQDTIECLESLQQIVYPNYQLIVVDNGSTDDSVEKIKAWAQGEIFVKSKFKYESATKSLRVIEYNKSIAEAGGIKDEECKLYNLPSNCKIVIICTGENLGFAGGNNVGIRYALQQRAKYIWILNNDTFVEKYSLSELVNLAENDEYVGMVGSKILFYETPEIILEAGVKFLLWAGLSFLKDYKKEDKNQQDCVREVEFISGASLLVRSEAIQKVGLIDESYFMYCEEFDWQIKMRKLGWKIMYCPTAKIWHKEGSSIGKPGSVLHQYYGTRNSIRLVLRYSKITFPLAVIAHLLRVLCRLLKGKTSQAFAIAKGIFHAPKRKGRL